MQNDGKKKNGEDGNVVKDDGDKTREWTKEEMEEAEPAPMPEVDDDDDED